MKLSSRKAVALAVAAGIALPSSAFATNGYFMIGFGPNSRAMGGVGVALGQDGLAAASNPAAMADVKMNTMRVDVGGEFFIPRRSVCHDSDFLPTNPDGGDTCPDRTVVSGSNLFLIPSMGGIYKFNRKIVVGMAAIGAGLGTRYDQTLPESGGNNFFNVRASYGPMANNTVGVSLMQMQMLPSVAYKLKKHHTLGASLAIAVQTFRAYGLGSFERLGFSASTSNMTDMGNDWSYGGGIRLGYLGKFAKKKLSVGVNWASRVKMTKFDKYKNLFAEQGSFDIPTHYAIGLAWKINKQWTVAADVQRIEFSSIKSVGNRGPSAKWGIFPPECQGREEECKTGKDDGLGFGWKDLTAYKVGLRYKHDKQWTFRAGYNYGKNPVPEDQVLFNLLAPGVVEHHVTLGFSYAMSPNLELAMNYMYAFKNTVTGKTPFPPTGISDPAELTEDNAAMSMYQHSLGIGIAYKM